MNSKSKNIIIIPIYHPDAGFNQLLKMLAVQQNIAFDLLILDSGSDLSIYKDYLQLFHYTIESIKPGTFNHGGTRQLAIDESAGYDFAIFLTQDAVPANEDAFANLIAAFDNPAVGCAYGRQLPNADADQAARFMRAFNYPGKSRLVTRADIPEYKLKAAFFSDAFSAYRIQALREVGGFPNDVIFGEDMYVAAKMLLQGWTKSYCADACVYHSHNYTLRQELKRYFDTGVFHAQQSWLLDKFGRADGTGVQFVKQELRYLWQNAPLEIPSVILHNGMKLIGYKMGLKEQHLPTAVKKRLSLQPSYWESR